MLCWGDQERNELKKSLSVLLKNEMNIFSKEDKSHHGFHYTSRETEMFFEEFGINPQQFNLV